MPSSLPVKTAVIGDSGNVGRYLWRSYRRAYPDCVGTSFSHPGDGLTFFDIRKPDLAALRLEETGHQALAICSANPNVASCEQQKEAAYSVNVEGTLELIRQAGRTALQVIFFSTDYVFEGRQGPYDDDAPTRPTTEYGRQKVAVEKALPSLAKNWLILRLSKIFASEKGDRTLLDEIASSLAAGRVVRAARDQIFCPTHVDDLVQAVQGVQALGLKGVMNVAHPRRWSRTRWPSPCARRCSGRSGAGRGHFIVRHSRDGGPAAGHEHGLLAPDAGSRAKFPVLRDVH